MCTFVYKENYKANLEIECYVTLKTTKKQMYFKYIELSAQQSILHLALTGKLLKITQALAAEREKYFLQKKIIPRD